MNRRASISLLAAVAVLGALGRGAAQDNGPKPFSPEQLDQMLAPIALYPDAVLAQTLMAASYPLEVVDAARWSKANPTLKGDDAVTAVKDKTWDVSVKSLTAFPQILTEMSDHLDWMQKLGDAMVAQQQDVADSIQRLRSRAADAGSLKSSKELTVSSQGSGDSKVIVVEPANPQVVYVPYYNPTTAYGTWPSPAYPPVSYPPPAGYGYGNALATGLLFGLGVAATAALFSSWNWGRGNSYVNVNVNRAVNIDRTYNSAVLRNGQWQHDPGHRRGVAYRDPVTRDRYTPPRPGADQRQDFRGRLDGQGPAAGQRPNLPQPGGGGQRPNLADRPGAGSGQAAQAIQNRGNGQAAQAIQNRGGGQAAQAIQNHQGGQAAQTLQNRAAQHPGGGGGGALSGVNRGQQVNREAARGRAQQARSSGQVGGGRAGGGGGGGGARGGNFGGRR